MCKIKCGGQETTTNMLTFFCSLATLHDLKLLIFLDTLSQYKCKEKFVTIQSIGIIAIKSRETKAVIYTCRYSSGHFNPYKCPLEYLQV